MSIPQSAARFGGFNNSRCDIRDVRTTDKKGRICEYRLYFQSLSKTAAMVNGGGGRGFLAFWHSRKAFQTPCHAVAMFCYGQS